MTKRSVGGHHESGSRRAPHPGVVTLGLAALHAVLLTLSVHPVNWWWLTGWSVAPLAWMALRARSTRRAVAAAMVAELPVWLVLEQWMIDVTGPGYLGLALYMAAYAGLFAWILRRVARRGPFHHLPMTAVIAVLWVGVEVLRGEVVMHGYPWYLAGHPWVEWPVLAQAASLGGAYLVSLLAVLPAAFVVDALRGRRTRRERRRLVVTGLVVVAAELVNALAGSWIVGAETGDRQRTDEIGVLVIQTNVTSDNKVAWTPEQRVEDFNGFVQQTVDAVRAARDEGAAIDLVVWPETMVPGRGLEPESVAYLRREGYFPGGQFAETLAELRRVIGAPLLVGSNAYVGLRVVDGMFAWDELYNSAYLVDGEPPYQRYDKVFLTPFGETMPYISAWPWLEQRMLDLGVGASGLAFNLDVGAEARRLTMTTEAGPVVLATPICFEDTVGRVCGRLARGGDGPPAHLFVNLSNDGWFGSSDAGRIRHAQIARFRCIEQRIPMIRAANTGCSMLVDRVGNVAGAIGPGRYGQARQAGVLRASVSIERSEPTLYAGIGDLFGWLCLLATVAAAALTFVLRQEPSRS